MDTGRKIREQGWGTWLRWGTGPFLKSLLNLSQYCLFCVLVFGCKACGIPAPPPGMEPTLPALKCEGVTAGPPGKFPHHFIFLGPFLLLWNVRLFVCLAPPKPFVTLSSCDSVALIEWAGYTPVPIISWAVLCPSHDCGPLYSPCLHKGCLRLIMLSTSHCDPMLG